MRTLYRSTSCIILSVWIAMCSHVYAQLTYIPDDNFEQAIIDLGYDGGMPDDYVPTLNIMDVDILDVSSYNIADLTGIEDFVALQELYCYNNQLNTLDLSNNIELTHIDCHINQLTILDVSSNTALETLWCYGNQLTTLDVNANTALTYLYCDYNQLTTLDVSSNTALTYLDCNDNQLTALDVSANIALETMHCSNNQLVGLDASNNPSLTLLHIASNPNLSCIKVEDAMAAVNQEGIYADWVKDEGAGYSENCPGSIPLQITTPSPTTQNPVPFVLDFAAYMDPFTAQDLQVTNGSVDNIQVNSPSNYIVYVTPADYGSVSLTVPQDQVTAVGGDIGNAAADTTLIYQRIALDIEADNPTNQGPVLFTLTFEREMEPFDAQNINITNGTITDIQPAGQVTYTVEVTAADYGQVTLTVPQDQIKGVGTLARNKVATKTVAYERISLEISTLSLTNQAPIPFTLNFRQDVQAFTAQDLQVTNGTIKSIQENSPSDYTVNIVPFDDGEVILDVPQDRVTGDGTLAQNEAATDTSIYDITRPSTGISTSATLVEAPIILVTVAFTEPIFGFSENNLVISNASINSFVSESNTTFLVELLANKEGQVTVQVEAGVTADEIGNENTSAIPLIVYYCKSILENQVGKTQFIRENEPPQLLTGNPVAGDNIVYRWQSSEDNSNWINIPGANGQNYQPGILPDAMLYRRAVWNGSPGCAENISNTVGICLFSEPNMLTENIFQYIDVINPDPGLIMGTTLTGVAYQWQDSTVGSAWQNVNGINSTYAPPPGPNKTVWYRRIVQSIPGCVSYSNVATVCVAIRGNTIAGGSPYIVAGNAPQPITGSVPGKPEEAAFSYQWQHAFDGQSWVDIPDAAERNYIPAAIGETIWYRRVVRTTCDTSASNEIQIVVNPPPVAAFVLPGYVCQANEVTFENRSGIPAGIIDSYAWDFGDGSSGSSEKNAKHAYTQAGDYAVTMTAFSNTGKSGTVTQHITVLPLPEANAGQDVTIIQGKSISLQASGGETYKWVPPGDLDNPEIATPIANPDQTTVYIVTVTNAFQCQADDSLTVTVIENTLVVQNLLTPGGNGKNDTWQIQYLNLFGTNEIKIFNRWGEEVYAVQGYQNNWNGTHKNGKQLPDGVYYYVIDLLDKGKTYKGVLTLMND